MDASPADPLPGFATRLRALRLERGLSQEALADLAQLDRTYVSSCEAGRRNVTLRTICRLAGALRWTRVRSSLACVRVARVVLLLAKGAVCTMNANAQAIRRGSPHRTAVNTCSYPRHFPLVRGSGSLGGLLP